MAAAPRLYLVSDRRLCGGEEALVARVEAALLGGVDAVQLRERDLEGLALRALAERLLAVCRRRGVPLLINDRIDVALAIDADGVHLPARSFRPADARALLPAGKLVGVSVHSAEELGSAAIDGADFAVFGPVYATASKAGYGPPQGLDGLQRAVAAARIPVLAIGGITAARIADTRQAGAAGVAVISAIMAADDAAQAARALASA